MELFDVCTYFHFLDYPGFEFEAGQRIVIYGTTGTGKTYVFTQILTKIREMFHDMHVVLVAPNFEDDKTYIKACREYKRKRRKKLIDVHFVEYNDQAKSFINGVIDRRRRRTRRRRKVDNRLILFAFDDVGEDHRINRTYADNPIKRMALSARHLNVIMVMMYQYMGQTMIEFGKCVQMVISKRLIGREENEQFRKLYLPEHTEDEYQRLCRMVFHEKYDSLVIDRREPARLHIFRNFTEEVRVREEEIHGIFFHFYVRCSN